MRTAYIWLDCCFNKYTNLWVNGALTYAEWGSNFSQITSVIFLFIVAEIIIAKISIDSDLSYIGQCTLIFKSSDDHVGDQGFLKIIPVWVA